MSNNNQQFESEILWDQAHKLGKAFKTKSGKAIMGDFNKTFKIVISENTTKWAKPGEYQIQLVPVKYKKVSDEQQPSFGSTGDLDDNAPF